MRRASSSTTSGDCFWEYAGARLPNIGLGAVAGRPNDEWGFEPSRFEDMRRGCFDVHERVRDMDIAGVMASLCFPSFPTISGALFTFQGEPETSPRSWSARTTTGTSRTGAARTPTGSSRSASSRCGTPSSPPREVRWLASKGCRAVTLPQHVGNYGQRAVAGPVVGPALAGVRRGVAPSSTSTSAPAAVCRCPSDLTNYLAYNAIVAIDAVRFTADLLFSRVVTDFPDLKIALSEGGIGWIPFVLERFEDIYSRQRAWTGDDLGDGLTPDRRVPPQLHRVLHPRPASAWRCARRSGSTTSAGSSTTRTPTARGPTRPSSWPTQLEGCTADEVEAITWRNAARDVPLRRRRASRARGVHRACASRRARRGRPRPRRRSRRAVHRRRGRRR